jgi:YbbR domain-containing protein
VKGALGIWLRRILEKGAGGIDRDVIVFAFFLLLSFIFWYLNSLGKNIESDLKYPVRYINLPKERILSEDLPSRLNLYLKGPGYSILKLKLSGSRAPLILDISTVNYRRVPGSKTLSYYILTSGLIPKLKNQLRTECEIASIKPDTLFFTFDRIIAKAVPVIPDVEVLTEKQYSVKGNIQINPDSVILTGPKHIIDTVTSIRTKFKRLTGVDETITRSIMLRTSKEYSSSVKKVILTIPVEQFTEAEIRVPVKIINSPDSIDVKIFPDEVTIRCQVAVSDYNQFKERPFEVVLDLNKANLNSADKIPVEIPNVPPFVNSLRVTPSKVDFLIEKRLK